MYIAGSEKNTDKVVWTHGFILSTNFEFLALLIVIMSQSVSCNLHAAAISVCSSNRLVLFHYLQG